jgi:uncharacterized membrane protein YidH (DUF202 family)
VIRAKINLLYRSVGEDSLWAQIFGLLLLPVAIGIIIYALCKFMRRTEMLRRKIPGPYEDEVGPAVVVAVLTVAIVASFIVSFVAE